MGCEGKANPQIPCPSDGDTADDVTSAAMTPSGRGIGKPRPHNENRELRQSQQKGACDRARPPLPTASACIISPAPSFHLYVPRDRGPHRFLTLHLTIGPYISEHGFPNLHLPVTFSRTTVGLYCVSVFK